MRGYLILIFFVLIILGVAGACLSDVFLTWANILNIVTASSTIGVLAIAAAFIIGAGGLDLSVGSIVALSAVTAGLLISEQASSPLLMIIVSLLTGAAVGGINGYLVGRRGVPAFIVTLGMLSVARGAALVLSDGRSIYGLPPAMQFIGQGQVAGIPFPVLVFAFAALVGNALLTRCAFGRHALAIGDNERAARNAGIRVSAQKIKLYVFSGVMAAVAGLLFMGRVNSADPNAGMMYELTAITAAIIGGTSLAGGRASVVGAVIGALIMGVMQNLLTLLDVPPYYQPVAIGVVLIVAVAIGQRRGMHAVAD